MEQTNTIGRKKLVTSLTLLPEIHKRVAELARVREWSIAQTSGYLVRLGLERLEEITEQSKPSLIFNQRKQ